MLVSSDKREESSYKEVCLASFIRARRGGSAPTRVVGLSSFASKLIGHQHRGQLAVVFLQHGDTGAHLPCQLVDVPTFIEFQCGVSVSQAIEGSGPFTGRTNQKISIP